MGTQQPIRKIVVPEIPDKLYFRIGDVARLCEVPAYVLRFWETEFPQLKPNKGGTGQRLYRRRDVEMALRIKSLLYDQGYTIPGARQVFKAETTQAQEARAATAFPRSTPATEAASDDTSQGGAAVAMPGAVANAASSAANAASGAANAASGAANATAAVSAANAVGAESTAAALRRLEKLKALRGELAALASQLSLPPGRSLPHPQHSFAALPHPLAGPQLWREPTTPATVPQPLRPRLMVLEKPKPAPVAPDDELF